MLSLKKVRFAAAAISASVIAFGFATDAQAASIGYSLGINDPVFNSAFGNENVPDFTLENISTLSSAQITDFTLTIGDTSFNYELVKSQSAFNDPGADLLFDLKSPDESIRGISSDVIEYNFTGFDPGDIFQFEADVDPDVGVSGQDYRQMLFPTAVLTVGFSNGETLSEILNPGDPNQSSYKFTQTGAVPVPEPSSVGALALLGLGAVATRLRRRAS